MNGGSTAFSAATDVARLKIVDNVAPAAPSTPDLAAASDSGVSSTDDVTSDTTPTFEGTAEANATIRLYANALEVASTTADGDGNWSVTSSALPAGIHAITVRAEDAAGNLGDASSALNVRIDTVAPAAPTTPDLAAAADTGASSTDNLTNATSLTFTGTAEANATVTLLSGGIATGVSVTADGSGNYSIVYDASGLSDGAYVFSTRTSDAAGNAGTASGDLTVTIDRTATAAAPALDAGSDSGTAGDGITADTTPTFVGSGAETGATVYLYADGNEIAQATVAGDGTWSATGVTPLVSGSYAITTRLADEAGNLSDASEPFALKVATNAPMVFAQTVGVTENSPVGSFVTQIGVIDLDADDTHSFALIDKIGTDEDESQVPFTIDANGEISVSGRIDYETRQTYTLRVQVTDAAGLSTERDLTVRVNDVAVNDTYYGTDGDDSIAFPGTSGFDSVDGGAGTDELSVTADRMLVVGSAYLGDYLAFSLDIDKVGGYEQFLFVRDIENLDLTAREIRLYGNLAHAGIGTDAVVLNGSAADNYFEAAAVTSNHAVIAHGGDGEDVIVGSANADTLHGDGGKDTLYGSAGADLMAGGTGTDTVDYSPSIAGVTVNLLTGVGNGGYAHADTLTEVENVIGSSFADNLTGSKGANRLEGGSGADRLDGGDGADTLSGGAGDDVLVGSAGADQMTGGDGTDTADYSGSIAAVMVNLLTGVGNGGYAHQDVLSGIETVIGSAFADVVVGDAAANRLEGGAGDDRLLGSAGADQMIGGSGTDIVEYTHSAAGVAVSLTSGLGSGGDAAGDILSSVENLMGSAFADTLTGDSGTNWLAGGEGADTLDGAGGNDVLVGGVGADRMVGGIGIDTVDYSGSIASVAVNLVTGKGMGGYAHADSLSGVENLIGSAFADTLTGDAAANRLEGGSGADTIGGGGGDDLLIGGAGADVMNGGDGVDTADYSASIRAINVDLNTGLGLGGYAHADVFVGIEQIIGSVFGDNLIGDASANSFTGAAGDDVLFGGAGSDRFVFGNAVGNDRVLDFAAGAGSEDWIDLSGNSFLNTFADVVGHTVQSGGDTLVDLGNGDTLTLVGVDRLALHQDDFIF